MTSDPLEARLHKLERLRQMGIDPYPHTYEPTHRIPKLVDTHEEGLSVKVAGRIVAARNMGRATFLDIVDQQAQIQLLLRSSDLGEKYELLDLLDIGDFVGVEGTTLSTRTGQYSVEVQDLQILSKSLRPLPDKWHGLRDPEIRYSQRNLDLLTNPGVADVFVKRAKAIGEMRAHLNFAGFMEVEVPLLQPVYGGASAKPFTTHVNALDRDYFLSISPELYLKKLIAGGLDAVYTLTKNFRNEGIDRIHNPEFTMMECYQAYKDYHGMMELTENMVASMATRVNGSTRVEYQDQTIDFEPPWKRLPMYDAVEQATGLNVDKMSEGELKDALATRTDLALVGYEDWSKGEIVEGLFDIYLPSRLVQPVFVTDHPVESTPLCKPHRDNPEKIERFEPYVAGMEIGNAYTELNDPILQRRLFEDQIARDKADNPYLQLDENFLRAIEHGMPPTGGLGIGVDRVVMILTDQSSIKDVVLFPMTNAELDS